MSLRLEFAGSPHGTIGPARKNGKEMGPLMKWVVQGQFKTQLRTLKDLLESGTSENSRAG